MATQARESLDSFETANQFNIDRDAVIFFAPGNWIHVYEFAKRHPTASAVIVEVWPELLQELIQLSDLIGLLPPTFRILCFQGELRKGAEKRWRNISREWHRQGRRVLNFQHPHTWALSEVQEALAQFQALH
jgi:hypothetical protein